MTDSSKYCRLAWHNPETGEDDPVVGTADYIPATAWASRFQVCDDGSLEPEYDGETAVHWDGQFNSGEQSGVKPYHHFAVVTESGEIVDVADCKRIYFTPEPEPEAKPEPVSLSVLTPEETKVLEDILENTFYARKCNAAYSIAETDIVERISTKLGFPL
jgi:hypothetical protein